MKTPPQSVVRPNALPEMSLIPGAPASLGTVVRPHTSQRGPILLPLPFPRGEGRGEGSLRVVYPSVSSVNPSPGSARVAILTLLILGGAVALALAPNCAPWLIYDRQAILSGQIWRMFTGYWVHFSTRHLVYDLLAMGMIGWIIEARRLPRFGWLCALAPWVISGALLVFEPRMRFCGGLSGLATAALVFLVLDGLADPPPWRWLCLAALLGIAGKTVFELTTGRTVLATLDGLPVVVSVTSHLAGAATALAFYAATFMASLRNRSALTRQEVGV